MHDVPLPSLAPSRRSALPLVALPVLLVAVIGVTGDSSSTSEAGPQDSSRITIAGFAFDAPTIEVAAGTTVTWINEDSAAHTVRDAGETFAESGDLAQGETFAATYDTPGEYRYVCGIHPEMRGTVTVV